MIRTKKRWKKSQLCSLCMIYHRTNAKDYYELNLTLNLCLLTWARFSGKLSGLSISWNMPTIINNWIALRTKYSSLLAINTATYSLNVLSTIPAYMEATNYFFTYILGPGVCLNRLSSSAILSFSNVTTCFQAISMHISTGTISTVIIIPLASFFKYDWSFYVRRSCCSARSVYV